MTKREELARMLCEWDCGGSGDGNCALGNPCEFWPDMLPRVDTILDALMEPGEDAMVAAQGTPEIKAVDSLIVLAYVHGGRLETKTVPLLAAWQAILTHIKEGR